MKTNCQLDYETVLSGRAEVVHLALEFKAEKQASARQTPFAFGLVIDNSGSMAGKPLEYAKAAAAMVLQNLRGDDRFGLVVFSDSARTVIPLQVATDKARLQASIAEIRDERSTNLTAGWMLGRDEVAKAPAEMPRKLLLLSDGHLNQGIIDPAQIRQIVGSGLEKERIRTSCLGFGDGYNEDLLDQLAKAGSGAMHDAASPEKFPGIFRQELESLLALSVQNLRVRVRKLHYCSGLALRSDYPVVALPEGGVEIMVGDLVSEEQRVVVLALEVLPIPPLADGSPAASIEGEALLDVELAYDEITEAGITSSTEQRTIRLAAVQSAADVRINERVVEWWRSRKSGGRFPKPSPSAIAVIWKRCAAGCTNCGNAWPATAARTASRRRWRTSPSLRPRASNGIRGLERRAARIPRVRGKPVPFLRANSATNDRSKIPKIKTALRDEPAATASCPAARSARPNASS